MVRFDSQIRRFSVLGSFPCSEWNALGTMKDREELTASTGNVRRLEISRLSWKECASEIFKVSVTCSVLAILNDSNATSRITRARVTSWEITWRLAG